MSFKHQDLETFGLKLANIHAKLWVAVASYFLIELNYLAWSLGVKMCTFHINKQYLEFTLQPVSPV